MNARSYNPTLVYVIGAIGAMAGLLFGFDHGVIAPAMLFLTEEFELTAQLKGMVGAAVPLGALIGGLLSGRFADLFGRRRTIIMIAIIFAFGSLQTALVGSFEWVIVGRVILGFAIGIASFTAPLYLAELAPARIRGALVSLNQLAITLGIGGAYLIGYTFAVYGGIEANEWRWMFGIGVVPAFVLLIGMYFLPESPRWLMLVGREKEASEVLNRVHPPADAERELQEIADSLQQKKETWRILLQPWLLPALAIGVGINFFQQVTGINTIIYYSPTIFQIAGFGSQNMSIFAGLIVSVVNITFTVISIMIIDKVGRKPLLLYGLTGMMLSLLFLGFADRLTVDGSTALSWLTLASVLVYISSFAISMGPIAWLLISEIFPLRIRGLAMSFAVATNWASAMLVVYTFPILLAKLGLGTTFWIFTFMCILALIFVYRFVPETKGVTLEQIEKNLRAGKCIREVGQV